MKNIRAAGTMLHHFAILHCSILSPSSSGQLRESLPTPQKYTYFIRDEMSSQRALKGFGTIYLGDGFFIIFIEVLTGELGRMILELRKRVRFIIPKYNSGIALEERTLNPKFG